MKFIVSELKYIVNRQFGSKQRSNRKDNLTALIFYPSIDGKILLSAGNKYFDWKIEPIRDLPEIASTAIDLKEIKQQTQEIIGSFEFEFSELTRSLFKRIDGPSFAKVVGELEIYATVAGASPIDCGSRS